VIEGIPTFGDESFAVSYNVVASDGYTFWVRSIRLRVGAVTVDVSLGGNADDLSIAAVEALTARQVACLGEAGCPDRVPLWEALSTQGPGPTRDSTLHLPAMVPTTDDLAAEGTVYPTSVDGIIRALRSYASVSSDVLPVMDKQTHSHIDVSAATTAISSSEIEYAIE
jgi:hypothetical protein